VDSRDNLSCWPSSRPLRAGAFFSEKFCTNPLAYGMPEKMVVFFDNSPVFKARTGVAPVAWFAGKQTLESGWAWGQEYLDGGVAVAEASVGAGKVFVMGPEVTFRGEPPCDIQADV